MARTARGQLEGRHQCANWIIFAELNNPCTIEDELNINGVKHVLAMFLRQEFF